MPKSIMLWEILVPTQMNDHIVRRVHHQNWDHVVRKIAGGLTINKPVFGQWIDKDADKIYKERMIPVRIACTAKQIHKIIDFTLKHYNQEACMVYLMSSTVIIKKRDKNTSLV